jgi:hypothetical protein
MAELKDDHHVRYHRVAERIRAAERELLGHLTGMNSDLGRRPVLNVAGMMRVIAAPAPSAKSPLCWAWRGDLLCQSPK